MCVLLFFLGMGFIGAGRALRWDEALAYLEYVKQHGIEQLLAIYRAMEDSDASSSAPVGDPASLSSPSSTRRPPFRLLWGDEIEYMLVRIDPHTKVPALRARVCACVVIVCLFVMTCVPSPACASSPSFV